MRFHVFFATLALASTLSGYARADEPGPEAGPDAEQDSAATEDAQSEDDAIELDAESDGGTQAEQDGGEVDGEESDADESDADESDADESDAEEEEQEEEEPEVIPESREQLGSSACSLTGGPGSAPAGWMVIVAGAGATLLIGRKRTREG